MTVRSFSFHLRAVPGVTLVELMVALSLMAIAATAAFQLMTLAETTLFQSRSELTNQQREEAVGSFIYEDFLADNVTVTSADNYSKPGSLPDDLQNIAMTLVPIFGTGPRYDNATPTCVLTAPSDPVAGTFSFAADCVNAGATPTLAQNINNVTATGAKAVLAIAGAGGKCTISSPITNAAPSQTAVATVEDSNCLHNGAGEVAPAGSEIIFPRFVAYSAADPSRYYTSLVENVTSDTPGLNLSGPTSLNAQSGIIEPITTLRLSALGPSQTATIVIRASDNLSRVGIGNPGLASLTDNNTDALTLTGNYEALRAALRTLNYRSPDGFFGNDNVNIKAVSGAFTRTHDINMIVSANCGNTSGTTAVRMDIGNWDNASQSFSVSEYLTTITDLQATKPSAYYGYCRHSSAPRYMYQNTNGIPHTITSSDTCQTQTPAGTYNDWTGKLTFGVNNAITVFLMEETGSTSYHRDRYTMFLLFESLTPTHCQTASTLSSMAARLNAARTSGHGMRHDDAVAYGVKDRGFSDSSNTDNASGYCHVDFRMNNIQDNRSMTDQSDPYTLVDDDFDHSATIGADGTPGEYRSYAAMRPTPDGAVIPLQLPADNYSASNMPELSSYGQDPDGDGNVNPRMELVFWDSLQKWRIRAARNDGTAVEWREITLTDNATDAVQLRVNTAQRCS